MKPDSGMTLIENGLSTAYERQALGGPMGGEAAMEAFHRLTQDPGLNRPYWSDRYGCPAVTVHNGRFTVEKGVRTPIRESLPVWHVIQNMGVVTPVLLAANANALPKDAWKLLDQAVVMAYRQPLTLWSDMMSRVRYGGFNGMNFLTLEYEAMSDPGEAVVSMEGMGQGRADRANFDLRSMPLPITHCDFHFSARRLAISANRGVPFSTSMAEAATRRVAETVEKTAIGVQAGLTFGTETAGSGAHTGTSTVWGATGYPYIQTKNNFTAPTANGWVPNTAYNEVGAATQQLRDAAISGRFMLYYSPAWGEYMDRVFSTDGGNHPGETLRTMLLKRSAIEDVKELTQFGSGFKLLLVRMTNDVLQAVDGVGISTMQWPTEGGNIVNYRVWCIQAPRFMRDYNDKCGVLYGTTS